MSSTQQCHTCIRNRHILIESLRYGVIIIVIMVKMVSSVVEPDYAHIIYGDVWRHVISEPPSESANVVQASKHLIPFIQSRHPATVTKDFTIKCWSELDLWHISSQQIPDTVTTFVKDGHDNPYPVSVPVSLGSTYNFQITFTKNESMTTHYMTVTKGVNFHVYSHTFYTVNLADFDKSNSGSLCSSVCLGKELPSDLHILSNLARNKLLKFYLFKESYSEFTRLDQPPAPVVTCSKQEKSKNIPDCLKHVSSPDTQDVPFEGTTVKVMSYNVWNYFTYQGDNGGYAGRIDRLLQLLDKAQPDIVGFQEVRFETPQGGKLGPSQMDHLMKQMPQYQFVYQPAMMHANSLEQGRTEEGVAIFSRFPILHHDYLLLFRNRSNSADTHQRVCLHAVVLVPVVGKVHIFNTHFSLSHEAREEAVTQILKYMELFVNEPMILMGDLNATPEEKSIRMLVENTGLLDVWSFFYPKSEGFTFSLLEEKLFKRIDYIFLKQKADQLTIQNIEVVPDKKRSEAASDHAAVMATFSFKHTNSL